ncbi:hypothetical protein ACFQNE_04290, partial [Gordonia phosphorivorans]|uniref:hypothetical protein n=1 Tax=Gordonia phosphorivorans TaxID=1056982 RepID=UPI003611652B
RPLHLAVPTALGSAHRTSQRTLKYEEPVKDRASWFDIVMGAKVVDDELTTDRVEKRMTLPPTIAEALRMDLTCG